MSGGRITLAIYIAIGFIPVVFGPAAVGQQSTHPMNTTPMSVQTIKMPPAAVPPGWTATTVTAAPVTLPEQRLGPEKVTIDAKGMGGSIPEHKLLFALYRDAGTKVELRGPCYSACTIVMTYVAKENLCIGPGAFMAFHAARVTMEGPIHGPATIAMYDAYPVEIRRWIDRNGGVGQLPLHGFWTMYDRDLWAFGYPRCAP